MNAVNLAAKFDPSRALAFLHIPKSAGTALSRALIEALGLKNIANGWDRSLFGDYDGFDSWDSGKMQYVYLSPQQLRAGADYVMGHLAASTLRARYPQGQLLTIVREPRSRLLSHWVFWRSKTGDLSQEIGTYAERVYLARSSLADFLSDPRIAPQIDNVCLRMLLWPHPLLPGDDFIAPEHEAPLLEEALRRLEGFDHIDIYENPEWPARIGRWLGRPLTLAKENVTQAVPEPYRTRLEAEMTPQAEDLLRRRARLDDRIWRAVAELVVEPAQIPSIRAATQAADNARFAALLSGSSSA